MEKTTGIKKFFFALILSLSPILFLIISEVLLIMIGFGIENRLYEKVPGLPNYYRDNPNYVYKYHTAIPENTENWYPNLFQLPKPDNLIRGVVIGGSTSAGFPYPENLSFSKILEEYLSTGSPQEIEILNFGKSAMSSYYIRDNGNQISALEPDFVIVYSGHNEIFGTISASTSNGHLSNLVYLWLKQFRTFQWFFQIFSPSSTNFETTMEKQFFAKSSKHSHRNLASISDILEENLDVFLQHLGPNTPTIIMEPISNLIDFPPFTRDALTVDPELYQSIFGAGSREDSSRWLNSDNVVNDNLSTAHEYFITAKAFQNLGDLRLSLFAKAKNLDSIPFRAPEQLSSAILNFSFNHSNAIHFSTRDLIIRSWGEESLSNQIFIDHLHFNFLGQTILAQELTKFIYENNIVRGLDYETINNALKNESFPEHSINFQSFYDITSTQKVKDLLIGEPFISMPQNYLLSYSPGGLNSDLFQSYPELRSLITQNENPFITYVDFLNSNNFSSNLYSEMLRSYEEINPGSYEPYLANGIFLAGQSSTNTDRTALIEFQKSLSLSENPRETVLRIKSMLINLGRSDLLEYFRD